MSTTTSKPATKPAETKPPKFEGLGITFNTDTVKHQVTSLDSGQVKIHSEHDTDKEARAALAKLTGTQPPGN